MTKRKLRLSGQRHFWLYGAIGLFLLLDIIIAVFLAIPAEAKPSPPATADIAAQSMFDLCKGNTNTEECYARLLGEFTTRYDMELAKQSLMALQRIDTTARGCHLIAHKISNSETRKDTNKWLQILELQDASLCTGGFIHGVLEAYMGDHPEFVLDASQFPIICNQVKDEGNNRTSCNHNLGHLLLAEQKGDIKKSVAICEQVVGNRERYECLSGTFMENLTRLNLQAHGIAQRLPWNQENTRTVEKLCHEFDGDAGKACWKEISYMYSAINRADPKKVFEACNSTPTEETAKECYIYGAGNMVVFGIFDPKKLPEVCTVYDEGSPLFKTCMNQITGSMIASSPDYADRVISLCMGGPEWYKPQCFQSLGNKLLRNTDITRRQSLCSEAPEQYRTACING